VEITKITAEMLEAGKISGQQAALFKKIFPNGAKITRANWEKAKGAGLNISFCVKFLSPGKLAEYIKIRNSAWEEYNKIRDSVWVEYAGICGSAWADYTKALGSTWTEYEKVCDSALFILLENQE
jgi:hypothetical protein